MKIENCIFQVSTFVDLKRLANPYVIDYRKLSFEELKEAMLKTAPQYCNEYNIRKALNSIFISNDQKIRNIAPLFIKEILLNKDDFMENNRVVEDEIILYEQKMIDVANEFKENSYYDNLKIFKTVMEAAWEKDNDISSDEQNLINRIKEKLQISDEDSIIVEVKIGKYPTIGNKLHVKDDIDYVRRNLQSMGLIFTIRNSEGKDYDVIPEEIAKVFRKIFNIDIRRHSYELLLQSKYVKTKQYLVDMLTKAGFNANIYWTLNDIQIFCKKHLTAHQLLAGFSPLDGLDKNTLSSWYFDLTKKKAYFNKNEFVDEIIRYYDNIKQIVVSASDEREILYTYFEDLASRNLSVLRQQSIIDKDLEIERKFEQATNYLFEVVLKNKPLILTGTEHPDGILSFNDKLIMWDNKSKESSVNLADHIKQFDRYIKQSEKEVAVFMVIGPEFTEESISEAAKYSLLNDTMILLITAKELKEVAELWRKKHLDEIFPLGYFKQNGRFNSKLVVV